MLSVRSPCLQVSGALAVVLTSMGPPGNRAAAAPTHPDLAPGAQADASALSEGFSSVRSDLGRTVSLLTDSFQTLHTTFAALEQQAQAQSNLMSNLAADLVEGEEGSSSKGGFVELVSGILQHFVDELVRVARDSMDVVTQMNGAVQDMDEVTQLVRRVKVIALNTKYVSLNASINAYENDNPQLVFEVFASEVRKLADEVNKVSLEIDGAVENAQGSLGTVLETVERLASRDMSESIESRERVDALVQRLEMTNQKVSETLALVAEQAAQGTRSLQFEDIVTQLLHGVEAKVKTLEGVAVSMAGGGASTELRAQLDGLAAKSQHVTQESMEAGDVELF